MTSILDLGLRVRFQTRTNLYRNQGVIDCTSFAHGLTSQRDAEPAADSSEVIFRTLSQEEYDRLSLEEKLSYLQRLMGDIREKTDETRRAMEARKAAEKDRNGG